MAKSKDEAPTLHVDDVENLPGAKQAYWGLMYMGVVMMVSLNVILSVGHHMKAAFKIDDTTKKGAAANPDSQCQMFLSIPQLFIVPAMVEIRRHVSFTIRIQTCFIVQFLCLIVLAILPEFYHASKLAGVTLGADLLNLQFWLYVAYVVGVFMIGVAYAAGQASIWGYASSFPGKHIGSCGIGTGISGLLIPVLGFLFDTVFPQNKVDSLNNPIDAGIITHNRRMNALGY
eukprot:166878_1